MSDLDAAAGALLADMKPTSPSAAPGQNFLPPNTRRDIPGAFGTTPVWRAGEGPPALFVHGWDDTHRVWRRFAQDFLQNTRPVLMMDLPAHGASKIEPCTPETAATSVADVCAAEGPIDTIIAHSFGCEASVRAIANGANPAYLVLIAPPLLDWADYQRQKGHADAVITRALELHRARTGADMTRTDFRAALADYKGAVLFVGSAADASSPLGLIRDLASALPGARLVEDETLSHRDLALDPRILAEIITFLGY
ncbi:alpha/beta fold hydrolase [Hyphomonas johnsonii]|uniref:Putative hydrolase n=1 Tax=Hyphomonas johnsonii MHS-2 TaxID=1280950 RepID=A0A059FUM0_9PROT|nr:alpha/beta hydrolase [Hyphomonas johnsonii]KCZ94390.1 putative hydrolase [Hyphomonas johnsonii MHS-2]